MFHLIQTFYSNETIFYMNRLKKSLKNIWPKMFDLIKFFLHMLKHEQWKENKKNGNIPWIWQNDFFRCSCSWRWFGLFHRHQIADIGEYCFEIGHLFFWFWPFLVLCCDRTKKCNQKVKEKHKTIIGFKWLKWSTWLELCVCVCVCVWMDYLFSNKNLNYFSIDYNLKLKKMLLLLLLLAMMMLMMIAKIYDNADTRFNV